MIEKRFIQVWLESATKENEKLKEQNKKLNQEILSCHDTLVTIEALCDAILNYDFKDTNSKVDFCHMLNEMDNKDLAFLKEAFTAIRDNNLKTMTSLTRECLIENEKEQRIEELEHELISLNGLYASDKEDMSYPFRLDFSKILNK